MAAFVGVPGGGDQRQLVGFDGSVSVEYRPPMDYDAIACRRFVLQAC